MHRAKDKLESFLSVSLTYAATATVTRSINSGDIAEMLGGEHGSNYCEINLSTAKSLRHFSAAYKRNFMR